MSTTTGAAGAVPWWKEPTKDQWMAWIAAWLGWTLDAFDFTIFLLIMVPISKEFNVPLTDVAFVLSVTLWLRLFGADRSPAAYVKSHAQRARDIMTREVISVAPDMPLADIATLFETRGIKRVPVMRGEKVVGIVTRANLVQALATIRQTANRLTQPIDQAIRGRLLSELERQPWWGRVTSNVIVARGVVHYFGMVDSGDERDAARVAAESVPGVRGVEDHRFRYSDITTAT